VKVFAQSASSDLLSHVVIKFYPSIGREIFSFA